MGGGRLRMGWGGCGEWVGVGRERGDKRRGDGNKRGDGDREEKETVVDGLHAARRAARAAADAVGREPRGVCGVHAGEFLHALGRKRDGPHHPHGLQLGRHAVGAVFAGHPQHLHRDPAVPRHGALRGHLCDIRRRAPAWRGGRAGGAQLGGLCVSDRRYLGEHRVRVVVAAGARAAPGVRAHVAGRWAVDFGGHARGRTLRDAEDGARAR
ncbi:hypothetical protein B0H17DRAFT_512957 [Mycena rosella]|uniref:Uncharacterized protein n=1 Tax=Mycena rosella TaxID=1033263 RepID=A0AAD7DJN5_MYCRO|nr:hypothetical protein B0H17DRAFT_512957 [Mycena rosella]